MPDDELTRRFTALSERATPLVEEPAVDAIRRRGLRHRRVRRVGALLTVAAVVLGVYLLTSVVSLGWPGDFFLDATCGGETREVKLRRSA
jgi:ferric-dicitrate binding protein FerR (iron transport regulator)